MNEPKVAYRNKHLLRLLPTYFGSCSFSTAQHFTIKPRAPPPQKNSIGAHFTASAPGAENPSWLRH